MESISEECGRYRSKAKTTIIQLPMLLVVIAWTIDFVHTDSTGDSDLQAIFLKKAFNSKAAMIDSNKLKDERNKEAVTTNELLQKLLKEPLVKAKGFKKRRQEDESDMVYRSDHVSQLLSDMFVNTDEEITALQAVEPEENTAGPPDYRDLEFFEFLRKQATVEPEDQPTHSYQSSRSSQSTQSHPSTRSTASDATENMSYR